MSPYFVSKILHYCNVSLPKCSPLQEKKIAYYDLTFVLSGSMIYTANGERYHVKKGDAIFLLPGTMRQRASLHQPLKYVSFNFLLLPETELDLPRFMPGVIGSEIKNLVGAFPQSHLSKYYHSHEKLVNLLNYVLLELLQVTSLCSHNRHVLSITRYVGEHLTEKMSLESISQTVGLTKEYTAYLFKKEMGRTLTDYINERKMLLAKELILAGQMTLSELSYFLGYDNYHYFSRLFKRYFQISPICLKNKEI